MLCILPGTAFVFVIETFAPLAAAGVGAAGAGPAALCAVIETPDTADTQRSASQPAIHRESSFAALLTIFMRYPKLSAEQLESDSF
jgi:hypothetical protein